MNRLLIVLLLGCAACAPKNVVTVYSPHGPDILVDYEQLFEAAHPEIDLQWLDMGSQDVYNRISAERNRPTCDVWWGGPSTMFIQASDEGLLESFTPTWSDSVGADSKAANGEWYGTHSTPLAIMFNNRANSRDTVPQSWDELLSPAWDGKISIRKPLPSGTMRTVIGAMIMRAESEDAGIAWLGKLHAATEDYMESPQLLFDHLKRNEELVTVWIMPDAVLQRERNGYPFDFFLPAGTPMLTEGIGIVKGAPNRANAETFYEFVTTTEALAHQAEAYAKIPARTDVPAESLPAWMVEQEIDPMTIDWARFAEKEKEWCDRWENEVFNSP